MKKILVVFTGGTIGSSSVAGTINPAEKSGFKLLQLFSDRFAISKEILFETLQPLQILSENMAPAAWTQIINAIELIDISPFDGIVVTHGTDTLAYTASVLSLYFNTLAKPLMLVSSNYPLENESANGLLNFNCAVEFICQKIANGVYVPYQNLGQTMQIHRGTRLTCSLQLTGDFYSAQGKSFLQFDGNNFFECPATQPNKKLTAATSVNPSNKGISAQLTANILMIKPYPGLNYEHFNLSGVTAVLHDLYHSGTACAYEHWGRNFSLLDFIARCQNLSIPLYLAPAMYSENTYQSTRILIQQGASMIWNMTIEAAYIKLLFAYSNFSDEAEILSFLTGDIAHERLA